MQQVENAQFFPRPAAAQLDRRAVCYGRSVANGEWDRMRAGTQGDAINPWGVRLFRTLRRCSLKTASSSPRTTSGSNRPRRARRRRPDRIHGAVGVIPTPLWIVLFFIAGVIFVFMLFFADRGERAVVQGMLIGSVVSVMAVLLLLLNGLDNPFQSGRRRPEAGRDGAVAADHRRGARRGREQVQLPCNAAGTAPS